MKGVVPIPKDLSRVKNKVMFGLTLRQLICFFLAGCVGFPIYLLTHKAIGNTAAAAMMIILVMPFFLFALYEKDGRPLEKILADYVKWKWKRPGIRTYRTRNIYDVLQKTSGEVRNDKKKEVIH